MMLKKSFLSALCLAAVAISTSALAQSYPSKPVKIIVPFAAGGPADNYARFISKGLQDALGQSFVVENRPGAGSVIGTDAVAKSAADGYTLLMMSNTQTVNETLVPGKPYQLMRDFVAVAPINYSDLVLVANPSTSFANLKDMTAQAKSKPGKINYASSGTTAGTLATDLAAIVLLQGANAFDQAGDTIVVKITGASVAGTDVFYVVQNQAADATYDAAADTVIALTGTSTVPTGK